LGLLPDTLFSFTWRELYHYAKGVRIKEAKAENHMRMIGYIFARANSNPKKPFPKMNEFWPIPELDGRVQDSRKADIEEMREIKRKLERAWRLSEK
jgi:hypothetical protein